MLCNCHAAPALPPQLKFLDRTLISDTKFKRTFRYRCKHNVLERKKNSLHIDIKLCGIINNSGNGVSELDMGKIVGNGITMGWSMT